MPQEFYTNELFLASFLPQQSDIRQTSNALNALASQSAVNATNVCKSVADAAEAQAIATAEQTYARERGTAHSKFDACVTNSGPAFATYSRPPCDPEEILIDGACYTPNGGSRCTECGLNCILDLQIEIIAAESKKQTAIAAAKAAKLKAYQDCYKQHGSPKWYTYPDTTRGIPASRPQGIQGVGISTGGSTRSKD